MGVQFGNNAVRGRIIGKYGTESYVPFRKYMINSRNINIVASSGSVMLMQMGVGLNNMATVYGHHSWQRTIRVSCHAVQIHTCLHSRAAFVMPLVYCCIEAGTGIYSLPFRMTPSSIDTSSRYDQCGFNNLGSFRCVWPSADQDVTQRSQYRTTCRFFAQLLDAFWTELHEDHSHVQLNLWIWPVFNQAR